MKRILITSVAAATLATSAFAYEGASKSMIENVEQVLTTNGYEVPVSSLTDQQVVDIYLAGTSGSSQSERQQKINSALEGEGLTASIMNMKDSEEAVMIVTGEDAVVISVQNYLDAQGFEADASALSDEQVAQLYFTAFGSSEEGGKKDRIQTILTK